MYICTYVYMFKMEIKFFLQKKKKKKSQLVRDLSGPQLIGSLVSVPLG